MTMQDQALSYCAREVRRFDHDRFLTALFAPADRREDLFALYAFNLEVAKTREVVSEPTLGLIRLQWWRETVEKAARGEPPRHEVAEPLAAAIARHRLDRALLDRLIDAREADLDDDPPADLTCLINYARVTGGPVTQLAVQVMGGGVMGVGEAAAMQAAGHVGMAWALTGILRAIPFLARAHRHRLPADLLATHGVTEPMLFELKPEPGLRAVVRVVADAARAELTAARALRRSVRKAALPALLPAALADLYLKALAGEGYDPFAPRLHMPHPFRQIKLGWAAVTGRW
ncbi:MAG: hypothetical protein RLY86_2898 [Pseudomonadota bacterium]|jgi:phytoene synthase